MARFGIPGSGRNPLAYVDDRLSNTPCVQGPREPTVNDTNYPLWTEWRVQSNPSSGTVGDFWKLVNFVAGQAIWVKISTSSSGSLISLSDTAGTKVFSDVDGNIQLEGTAGQIDILSDAGNNKLVFSLPDGVETAMSNIIVDPAGIKSDYDNITDAMAAASSGDTIGIKPGVYTEDITWKAGVNLVALGGGEKDGLVAITGKLTCTEAGEFVAYGIKFTTNGDYFLEVTGSNNCLVYIIECRLSVTDNDGINFTNSGSSQLNLERCIGSIASTFKYYNWTGTGTFNIRQCRFGGATGVVASTATAGSSQFKYTEFNCPLQFSSASSVSANYCNFNTQGTSSIPVDVTATSGTRTFLNCSFTTSGSFAALNIGASSSATLQYCNCTSSDTFAISGTGTISFGSLTFGGSSSDIEPTHGTISNQSRASFYTNKITPVTSHITKTNITNSAQTISRFQHRTSGTPAAGFASCIELMGDDDANTLVTFSRSCGELTDATTGSISTKHSTTVIASGSEVKSLEVFPYYMNISKGTTAQRPGSPVEGDFRGNTTANVPEYYDGSNWQTLLYSQTKTAFTPVLAFGAGTTGITYSTQTGWYVQYGDMIMFSLRLVLTSKGTDTGNASISGLPTAATIATPVSLRFQNITFTTQPVVIISGVSFSIYRMVSASGTVNLTDAQFANNSSLEISGTYLI